MFQQTQDDVTKASTKALIVGLFENKKIIKRPMKN